MYSFDEIKTADPQIAQAIELEIGRQNGNIELIAYLYNLYPRLSAMTAESVMITGSTIITGQR